MNESIFALFLGCFVTVFVAVVGAWSVFETTGRVVPIKLKFLGYAVVLGIFILLFKFFLPNNKEILSVTLTIFALIVTVEIIKMNVRGLIKMISISIVVTSIVLVAIFAMSPGNMRTSLIAFHSKRNGYYAIYTVNSDGSDLRQLTDEEYKGSFRPSWSPDGKRIVFDSNHEGGFDIYVMNSDGTNKYRLTNQDYDERFPSWSPDGEKIAFSALVNSYHVIYTINVDGTGRKQITPDEKFNNLRPFWSKDGSRMVFLSDETGQNEIYIMNIDGTDRKRLTFTKTGSSSETPISWSIDNKITFCTTRDKDYDIYVMDIDGTKQSLLIQDSNGIYRCDPSWSPDGRYLAFKGWRSIDNYDVYVIDMETKKTLNLTSDSLHDDSRPQWQPMISDVVGKQIP